jgi:hypothetical protein
VIGADHGWAWSCSYPPTRQDECEVAWRDDEGDLRRAGLTEVATAAFEFVSPVRGFASFRGQRNFPGLWWFATTGEHVGYESWLERDQVMAMDADPDVVGLGSQPMWLHWTVNGREHATRPGLLRTP